LITATRDQIDYPNYTEEKALLTTQNKYYKTCIKELSNFFSSND